MDQFQNPGDRAYTQRSGTDFLSCAFSKKSVRSNHKDRMNLNNQALTLLPTLPGRLEWQLVNQGESGDIVYRRSDGQAFAKIASPPRAAALESEFLRCEWLSAWQIGSPEVLDWVKSDLGGCLITTGVPGIPADELSADSLMTAWPSIATKFRQLHQIPVSKCPFERKLSSVFDLATDVVGRNAVNIDFLDPADQNTSFDQLLDALKTEVPLRTRQETQDLVVCHGDACMPNIMVDPVTLQCTGIIDLGRLGVADRYTDLALLLGNTRETWLNDQQESQAFELLFKTLGISNPDRERLAFYLRLDPLTWG
jgi:streptomycin 3"-kinase